MLLKYSIGSVRVASPSPLCMRLNVLPTARVWEKRRIVFTREELFIAFVGGDVVRDMIPLAEVSCVDQVDRAKAIITTILCHGRLACSIVIQLLIFAKIGSIYTLKSNFSQPL